MSGHTTVTFHKRGTLIALVFIVAIVISLVLFVNVRAAQSYRTCLQLYQATGQYAVPRGSKLYVPALDRNSDGIACSEKP